MNLDPGSIAAAIATAISASNPAVDVPRCGWCVARERMFHACTCTVKCGEAKCPFEADWFDYQDVEMPSFIGPGEPPCSI